jgi:hypothetical protein
MEQYMITIEYCEYGRAVSDFDCLDWLDIVKSSTDGYFQVSTSVPISVIRLAIAKGEINYNNVVFIYNNITLNINEYGSIIDCPKGFCDIQIKISEKILTTACYKRKNK